METILIALLLVALPLVLFAALSALDRKRRDESHRSWLQAVEVSWESLVLQSSDLRLSVVEDHPVLHGTAGASRFKVFVDATASRPGRVGVESQAAMPQGFTLFLAPAFGASATWTTGDVDFDASFIVSTSDESLTASLLTERVRAALLSLTLQDLRVTATSVRFTTDIDPCALDRAALDAAREVVAAFAGSTAPEAAQG
ncbi:MAG: hypothetical protein R3A48_18925 [Polyangiales bacterium]